MDYLDTQIVSFLNSFTRRSVAFDVLVVTLSDSNLFKGGLMVALLWWAWFRPAKDESIQRAKVTATMLASLVALFIARALALTLPFRVRPIHDPRLEAQLAYGMDPAAAEIWSAFPSDHATLFFALATGVYFVSRPWGVVAALYALTMICLPRIYLAMHFPSDIVVGALLGIGICWGVVGNSRLMQAVQQATEWCLLKYRGLFYAGFFLLTYQIATLFNDVREVGQIFYKLLFLHWGARG